MKGLLLSLIILTVSITSCKKDKDATEASITTTSISNITSNSALGGGNISDDGGSPISQRGVCWAIHTNPGLSDSITKDGSGSGSFVSSIRGLIANTTYYVRAYVINGVGTAYGSETTFIAAKGMAAVTTMSVTDIAPLTAKCGGTVVGDGGANVTERGIVYGSTSNPTILNNKIISGTGTGAFNITFNNLPSESKFYVRAYATNSFGTAYGNEVIFTSGSATFSDIDGNVYSYIKIGSQIWMTSNLKVSKYRNGDPITNGLTGFTWNNATIGAYTFPNQNVANNDIYGKLYNVPAVLDSRGIAPQGWHIPSDEEWKILEKFLGMSQTDADMGGLRGSIGQLFVVGGSSGLNLQNSGIIFPYDNSYLFFNEMGFFSTTTSVLSGNNYYRAFNEDPSQPGLIDRNYSAFAVSVRCIKD